MKFAAKVCRQCGAVFAPKSGAQKWCKTCRPGGRGRGDEPGIRVQIREIREKLEDALERLDEVEGKAGVLWDERHDRKLGVTGEEKPASKKPWFKACAQPAPSEASDGE